MPTLINMRTKLQFIAISIILSGCFFPHITVNNVEKELEIEIKEAPRSLLFHEMDNTESKAIYYAIEISQNQFDEIIDSWSPVNDPVQFQHNFNWNEIGQTELQEWNPKIDISSYYFKELNQGGYVAAQYNGGWMFVIKKEK